MLDQQELRRRIRAARVLADISQADMNVAGHDRGLGKHELGGAERGDIDIRQYHLPMLCEILKVPMSWFTEPRKVIVAQRAADYVEVLDQLFDLSETPAEAEQRVRDARRRRAQRRQQAAQAPRAKRQTGR